MILLISVPFEHSIRAVSYSVVVLKVSQLYAGTLSLAQMASFYNFSANPYNFRWLSCF